MIIRQSYGIDVPFGIYLKTEPTILDFKKIRYLSFGHSRDSTNKMKLRSSIVPLACAEEKK